MSFENFRETRGASKFEGEAKVLNQAFLSYLRRWWILFLLILLIYHVRALVIKETSQWLITTAPAFGTSFQGIFKQLFYHVFHKFHGKVLMAAVKGRVRSVCAAEIACEDFFFFLGTRLTLSELNVVPFRPLITLNIIFAQQTVRRTEHISKLGTHKNNFSLMWFQLVIKKFI